MPLIKIDYVVSFSSEDPENPASNLLVSDVKSKWLCKKGEPSCSVVLQLQSACKIETITLGAYHVALLEILVGLSEKPSDPFQVLVPSCVLQSPGAARRGELAECVRSFGAAQLAGAARAQRWDRLRLVCSQPYNKHCQYGLGFVHVAGAAGPAAVPRALLAGGDSSDEEFLPGELFAKHCREPDSPTTDSQIRRASSRALKNIDDTSCKLVKTPIAKTGNGECGDVGEQASRRSESLPSCDDDGGPQPGTTAAGGGGAPHRDTTRPRDDCPPDSRTPSTRPAKRTRLDESSRTPSGRPSAGTEAEPGGVLAGVVLALSGYANPRRAALRGAALRLGAQYRRDWQPDCTHLVCAFPNTPKLRAARAVRPDTPAVTGDWLERCERERRRLPWQWFAAEPARRLAPPAADRSPDPEPDRSPDADTDDEIEEVSRQRRRRKRARPPASPRDNSDDPEENEPAESAPASPHDDSDTAEDEPAERAHTIDPEKRLPRFWAGRTFAVAGRLRAADAALLARYVRAYGGLVLQAGGGAQYAVGASGGVRPGWVWRAHRRRRHAEPEPHDLEPAS